MQKNRLLMVLLALVLAACAAQAPTKVNLQVPGPAAIRWDEIKTVLLTGFFLDKEFKEFDLNKTLVGFFRDELKLRIRGSIEDTPIVWENADSLASADFWKTRSGRGQGTLILTGKVQYSQETRKALLEGERRPIDEGPFKPENPWSERRAYTLKLDLAIIDPATGQAVFRKDYEEAVNTENLKQTAEFALYELMARIRPRVFRVLFGAERPLDRYLLSK